jgi:cation diffusion facilitator CzcD-associated flavoprotein CzcO
VIFTHHIQKHWSSFYSPGPEIRQYLEGVVDKYRLRTFIKLQHRVSRLRYDESTGKWHISVTRPVLTSETTKFEEFNDVADVVISALGNLRIPSWPDIEGIKDFQGELIHSADWKTKEGSGAWEDTVKTWSNKRVGVIGVVCPNFRTRCCVSYLLMLLCLGFLGDPDSSKLTAPSQTPCELCPRQDLDFWYIFKG